MTEFGGPEVLRLAELPDPRAAAGRGGDQGHPGRAQLRRHPHPDELLCAEGHPAAGSGRRGRRDARGDGRAGRRTGRLAAATPSTPSAPRERIFAIPDGVDDGTALALVIQGTTAWHLLRTAARAGRGRERRRPLRRRRRRLAGDAAGRSFGAGRVIATASSDREARAGDGARRRHRRGPGDPEGLTERLIEANGGREIDVVLDSSGGRSSTPPTKRWRRSGGSSSTGSPRANRTTVRTGSLLRHSRSVVGFYLFHTASSAPGMFAEALADLFARAAERRAAGDRRTDLSARGGPAGADRPARAAHDRQAAARPDRLTWVSHSQISGCPSPPSTP